MQNRASFAALQTLARDIRQALHYQSRRRPGFAIIAAVTLALGISASERRGARLGLLATRFQGARRGDRQGDPDRGCFLHRGWSHAGGFQWHAPRDRVRPHDSAHRGAVDQGRQAGLRDSFAFLVVTGES